MQRHLHDSIVLFKLTGTLPITCPSTKSNFRALAAKFALDVNTHVLFRNGKKVLLEENLDEVWQSMHLHAGRDKTWARISQRFYFKGGEKWVRQKTRECVPCGHKNNIVWSS